MKKAGFSSGKCEGSACDITMVGDNTPPGSDTATVMKDQLEKLGFNVNLQEVEHTSMYTRFCSVVKSEPNVCPNVGWIKDFNDGQGILQVPFSGSTITASPANNSNWSQLNDPTINKAIDNGVNDHRRDQRAACLGEGRRPDLGAGARHSMGLGQRGVRPVQRRATASSTCSTPSGISSFTLGDGS